MLLAGLLLVALSLVAGAAVARFPPTYTLGLAGLGGAVAVARWNRGVLAGGLVLLVLNGVPFVNTRPASVPGTGANVFSDLAFLALVVLLACCAHDRIRNKEQDRIAVLSIVWAVCYLAWWSLKILAGSPGIPFAPAVQYGREFMYFSLFLPLALLGLRRRRHLVGFATSLAVGAALFSIGQIVEQLAHTQLTWLFHVEKLADFEGVARIYAPMNDLLIAAFPMAFAAMLLAPKSWRRRAMFLTALTGFANALTFTRAVYVSELLALALISVVWAAGSGWRPRRIRHAFSLGLAAIVVAVSIAAAGASATTSVGASSPIQTVVARAELGFSNVQGNSGTFGQRLRHAHRELEVLGGNWIGGLGFLNPSYHYVDGLIAGSIRDSDLGSLNILMTMGLVGLLLAYMPPLAGLGYLLRRRRGFIQYGGAMYLTAALVGSVTLDTISSVSGLLVLGSMLALCLNYTALDTVTTAQTPKRAS